MERTQLRELLLESLVHERGGTVIYRTALDCAINDDLRKEWQQYLAQTQNHVTVLTQLCQQLGWDPKEMTPGCKIVQQTGIALVVAMKMALAEGDSRAAELVACDSVLLAETKDHANWELICACAQVADGATAEALTSACEAVEGEEDKHLYHTQGWSRELHRAALGLEAELPPPEEEADVESAADAEEAKKSRGR